MTYNKEFLISELQRFVEENGRNPRQIDIQIKFGYPAAGNYRNYFGSWNNALLEAGFNINRKRDRLNGTEICDNCGQLKENQWYYKDNQRLCKSCYCNSKTDYMNKSLDPNSETGFAFVSQRVVAETLGLDLKYDCNCSIGFGSEYDLLDKTYKYINVKAAILQKDNAWHFNLKNKYTPDTYIMLGFANDKSNILYVWITEPEDDLTFDEKNCKIKQGISITNSERGLKRAKSWEVDVEPYNYAYHNMSLKNCSVLRSD